MHSSSRHTFVSVVVTVAAVAMTVLLATWFPAQNVQPAPGNAATVAVLPGE